MENIEHFKTSCSYSNSSNPCYQDADTEIDSDDDYYVSDVSDNSYMSDVKNSIDNISDIFYDDIYDDRYDERDDYDKGYGYEDECYEL
jgi:hypothetical protein